MNYTVLIALVPVALWGLALCVIDCRTRKLPNFLTLSGLIFILVCRAAYGGVDCMLDGFKASLVAALVLLIPYWKGGAGAGDVKFMACAGAISGLSHLVFMVWVVSLSGLIFALGHLALRRVDAGRVRHVLRSIFDWRYDRKRGRATLPSHDDERARMPFGIPIFLGILACYWSFLTT